MLTIKKKSKFSKQTQEQQIATITHKITELLSVYKKQLVIAATLLAALVVIAGGYILMRSADERKASPLVALAYEQYNPLLTSTPDHGKALELFRGIQKKYPRTMSAAIAQYYVGNTLTAQGKMDEALKEYQLYIDNYSDKKILLGLVYQRMGYIYSGLGKQAEAIKAFELSEALEGPGVATIELARLYETSGNVSESQKKYKLAQEKLGGTSWGIEAMGKVQVLKPASQPAPGSEGE